jgi:hypothetical protein
VTRREWKRRIYGGLAVSLGAELENGSGWLFDGDDGEPIPEAEERRMRAAAAEVIDECFRRRHARTPGNPGKETNRDP